MGLFWGKSSMNGSKFDANIGKIWKNIVRKMILFLYCELRQLSGEPAPYDYCNYAPAAPLCIGNPKGLMVQRLKLYLLDSLTGVVSLFLLMSHSMISRMILGSQMSS